MEVNINASHKYSDRLHGEVKVDLFNQFYVSVRTKRFSRDKRFRMEVATLNPEGKKVFAIAWKWLLATLLTLSGLGYFLYYIATSAESFDLVTGLIVSGVLLLLTGIFVFLFRLNTVRKWIFVTRAARYPLVNIPFTKETRQQADELAVQLTRAINNRVEKRGYSENDLLAGEMRMLRRMNESGILSTSSYESARKSILKKQGVNPA